MIPFSNEFSSKLYDHTGAHSLHERNTAHRLNLETINFTNFMVEQIPRFSCILQNLTIQFYFFIIGDFVF